MTADEPDTSTVPLEDADQERWLTYLNYDQSVKQAVRRLTALSNENVDLFRGLLMQGRDRSRVAEYEAESVRRLQGEAFVGDEELQRTLIVLHAEDPHLAEEFKRLVAETGKPQELDQTIAAIRAKMGSPVPPRKLKLVETPPAEPSKITPVETPAAAAETAAKMTPAAAPVAEIRRQIAAAPVAPTDSPKLGLRPLGIAAALLLIAIAGLVFLWPRLGGDSAAPPVQTAAAPQAVAPDPAPSAALPSPSAASKPAPAMAPAAQAPVQNEAKNTPQIRPASDGPDKIASDAAPADARSAPIPGTYYKVVRGDMLTDIAVRAYRDASKFLVIQRANPSLRASADRILVDQVIFIPRAP